MEPCSWNIKNKQTKKQTKPQKTKEEEKFQKVQEPFGEPSKVL